MRGTQRKIIHVKNTGSLMFEEAYFLIREGKDRDNSCADLIKEANRLITEQTKNKDRRKLNTPTRFFKAALTFITGFVTAALIIGIAFLTGA